MWDDDQYHLHIRYAHVIVKTTFISYLPVASYGENIASDGAIQRGGTSLIQAYCFLLQSSSFLITFHALYVLVFNHVEKPKFLTVVQPTVPHGTPSVPHGTPGVPYGAPLKIRPLD
jgi:hypothetical protein